MNTKKDSLPTVITTKVCPYCSCTRLVLLHSTKKKLCGGCRREFDWPLDEGQKPTY